MNKEALIIFIRNPEWGQVKTRLAKTIGPHKALLIYKELLEHTYAITRNLDCDKYVYYADRINPHDLWKPTIYRKQVQSEGDLGKRMNHAFRQVFQTGYSKVMIIGSDCYELAEKKLAGAFRALDSATAVIGPASDGGYYLLGLTELIPKIFEGVAWSTSGVFNQTVEILQGLSRDFVILEQLSDIDDEKDLTPELKDKVGFNDSNQSLNHPL